MEKKKFCFDKNTLQTFKHFPGTVCIRAQTNGRICENTYSKSALGK